MSGSFVIAGQGLARLEKVGNDSYINQLSLEAKQVKSHEESDMVHAVNQIVGIIGLLIIPLGSLLFLRSYISLGDSLKLSVTSTVGALIGDDSRRLVSLDDLGTGSRRCQISQGKGSAQ